MSVLVIGGGFIGLAIARAFQERGSTVTVVSRRALPASDMGEVEMCTLPMLGVPGSTASLAQLVKDSDVVVNSAWENYRAVNSEHNLSVNLPFQQELIDCVLGHGKRLINLGTAFEYGIVYGPVSELTPCRPVTTYGVAKDILRNYAFARQNHSEGSVLWLRIFNVLGKEPPAGTFFYLLQNAVVEKHSVFKMSRGDQLRDFINVTTLANQVALLQESKIQGLYNLGTGDPKSVYDLACKFFKDHDHKIMIERDAFPVPEYESLAYWADISKLREALGPDHLDALQTHRFNGMEVA